MKRLKRRRRSADTDNTVLSTYTHDPLRITTMNGHSFASLALSFLMVGLAAIILRPSERDSAVATAVAPPPPTAGEPDKPPPPELARADSHRDRQREPAVSAPLPSATPRPRLAAASAIKPLPKPAPPPPAPPVIEEDAGVIHPPASAFTQVEPGETLALVARRVYGSSQARDRLWRGNRDLLSDPEMSLRTGTILRTP
ncbi:MAG: hypothetical protein U0800_19855 [Isosphaeraceae bacterium]